MRKVAANQILAVVVLFALVACERDGISTSPDIQPLAPADTALNWDDGNWDEEEWQ